MKTVRRARRSKPLLGHGNTSFDSIVAAGRDLGIRANPGRDSSQLPHPGCSSSLRLGSAERLMRRRGHGTTSSARRHSVGLRVVAGVSSVPIAPMPLERFRELLAPEAWAQVEQAVAEARALLRGRTVWSVNSTAAGGGVAEMLRSIVGYSLDAGVDARWVVIGGDAPFFALTKRLAQPPPRRRGRRRTAGRGGAPVLRGRAPQRRGRPAPPCRAPRPRDPARPADGGPGTRARLRVPVVWRSHIGRDAPNEHSDEAVALPAALCPPGGRMDLLAVVVRPAGHSARPGDDRAAVDRSVFATKNEDLTPQETAAIIAAAGLVQDGAVPGRPTSAATTAARTRCAAVRTSAAASPRPPARASSRRSPAGIALKDPLGVLRGFVDHVAALPDAHLVLAGPGGRCGRRRPGGRGGPR